MNQKHNTLQHHALPKGTCVGSQGVSEHIVKQSAPATDVMTDLSQARAFTIHHAASMMEAQQKMIVCGVRLLFVVHHDGELEGLITATDLLGERPLNYLREQGGTRDNILVGDIMTRYEQIEALEYSEVVRATVDDLLQTLHDVGRQHILVVENNQVRGLFSATEVARKTRVVLELDHRAHSFAELESMLVA